MSGIVEGPLSFDDFCYELGQYFGIAMEPTSREARLGDLGIDSLSAVELAVALEDLSSAHAVLSLNPDSTIGDVFDAYSDIMYRVGQPE